MGSVDSTLVDLQQIGKTTELRIDAHYFSLLEPIQQITQTIIKKIPLTVPPFGRIQNGVNLPETAYEIDNEDPACRYVSVGAISQFALRHERATPLRSPDDYAYEVDLQSIACRDGEVLITRSGTPGVAWPVTSDEGEGPCLIPSGFVIRAQCPPSILDAHYVAAVLNHPVWRVWSAGLAAGKRQRNLSHDHLAQIFLPALPYPEQVKIGERYRTCLANIERLLSENPSIRADCDSVLRNHLSVSINSLEVGSFSFDTVSILACANSPIIRMDSRFHRSEVRAVVAPLDSVPHTSLGSLTRSGTIKGGQPSILTEDSETSTTRVVATVAIQAGTVVRELTKPTTAEEIANAGDRQLQKGDLLVTMDGEGSIGKAAVFQDEYDAITDSHVAIIRFANSDLAMALACWINSSCGQAQIELAISGATGQTQLSKGDLENLQVPIELIERAVNITADYQKTVRAYQPVTTHLRRLLCCFSVEVSEALIYSSTLGAEGKSALEKTATVDELSSLLSSLKPELF